MRIVRQSIQDSIGDRGVADLFVPLSEGKELEFLKWDDWRVLGRSSDGAGGEHGQRLTARTR